MNEPLNYFVEILQCQNDDDTSCFNSEDELDPLVGGQRERVVTKAYKIYESMDMSLHKIVIDSTFSL